MRSSLPSACIALLFLQCTATHIASAQSNSARSEYAHAEALIRDHQWDAGVDILRPLLQVTPPNPKVFNLMGLAFAGKKEPRQATLYFEQALKIDPNFTPALKNLAIEEIGVGEIAAAKKHLETALQQSPEDPIVNLYLGEIFYQQSAFAPAVEHLRRAGSLSERDPNVLASLAISEFKTDQREDGLRSIRSLRPDALNQSSTLALGVELAKAELCDNAIPYLLSASMAYPADVDIGYDLGVCYLAAKQYPEAAATLQTLIDEGHESSEIDNTLAEAYEAENKTQKAVDALRRAISLNPGDDENYLDFASICLDHQDFTNAAKVLSVGLDVHPKSSRLVFERGILNAMQDRFEDAEKDFQLSSDLAPESDAGYIGLGVTYLETGKAAQAVPVLRSRLHDHPDDANLNFLLAEALLRSGVQQGSADYAEAQTRLERSTQLNPNMVEPHVSLGKIYLQEDKPGEAAQQFERARKIDPNSKAACAHLAVAYRKLGQTDKAREVLLDLKAINDRERAGVKGSGPAPDPLVETKAPPTP